MGTRINVTFGPQTPRLKARADASDPRTIATAHLDHTQHCNETTLNLTHTRIHPATSPQTPPMKPQHSWLTSVTVKRSQHYRKESIRRVTHTTPRWQTRTGRGTVAVSAWPPKTGPWPGWWPSGHVEADAWRRSLGCRLRCRRRARKPTRLTGLGCTQRCFAAQEGGERGAVGWDAQEPANLRKRALRSANTQRI